MFISKVIYLYRITLRLNVIYYFLNIIKIIETFFLFHVKNIDMLNLICYLYFFLKRNVLNNKW